MAHGFTERHLILAVLALGAAPLQAAQDADPLPSPQVGQVAPELGAVQWRQLPSGKPPRIQDLRGKVVVVQTWVWYCDSCVKYGVPTIVDTQRANADRGLVTISLQGQNQRDDVADDHWVGVGKEMGMQHDLGETAYFGEWSPYFNLNANSSPTYGFIIGRSGVLRWRGDLSTDTDEFLEELERALSTPDVPALPAELAPELERALQGFVAGDLGKARKEAAKVHGKLEKSSREDSQVVAEQAAALVASLDDYEQQLFERVQAARLAEDAEGLARSLNALQALFPKGAHAKELKALEKEVEDEPGLAAGLDAWRAWFELEAQRPATFPARKEDKSGKRFAKRLEDFVTKQADSPAASIASAWLERWGA